MKKSKKLKLFLLSLLAFFVTFTNVCALEETSTVNQSFLDFIEQCYYYQDTMVVTKDDNDITNEVKPKIITLYEEGNFDEIKSFLDENLYDVSYIENNSKARGFTTSKFTMRKPRSKTLIVNDTDKNIYRELKASWVAIITCDFGYNDNTYKVGNVYDTKISLESYYVGVDLEYASLINVSTPKGVVNADKTQIAVQATYTLSTKYTGIPFTKFNCGPYTEKGTAKP